jgi:glutamyl-tRNA reductase
VTLVSVGVDHEHASLEFLERATVLEHEWTKVLRALMSHRNIHEAVFISTCLRTEVVAVVDRFHGAIDEITAVLAEATGLDASAFEGRLTIHFDRGVVTHLFSVAAGLKSVVPGEFEVLGQLRRAFELASDEQTAGAELTELFHRAIATGRRVRSDTAIARGTTSFAQAAVTMALEELGAEIAGADVVVVGAGQLASGIAKSLLDLPERLATLTLCNRTTSRVEALRLELADERVLVGRIEDVPTAIDAARLAFVAVEVTAPVVAAEHLALRAQPLLVVDLGVPRAVASDVGALAHVHRVDIGDLRERVDQALGERHGAFDEAQEIVLADVEKYMDDQRARGAATIVRELREHFDQIVAGEMARREHEFDDLTDEQRDRVRSLLRSVVAKIAHRPTVALKEAAGMDQGVRLSEATRELFDL